MNSFTKGAQPSSPLQRGPRPWREVRAELWQLGGVWDGDGGDPRQEGADRAGAGLGGVQDRGAQPGGDPLLQQALRPLPLLLLLWQRSQHSLDVCCLGSVSRIRILRISFSQYLPDCDKKLDAQNKKSLVKFRCFCLRAKTNIAYHNITCIQIRGCLTIEIYCDIQSMTLDIIDKPEAKS